MKSALAIMTTDTLPKMAMEECKIGNEYVKIYGIAKGSGMIQPNMGTTLCYIFTDATISNEILKKLLKKNVANTFNAISCDGDTSTNDMIGIFSTCKASHVKIKSISDKNLREFDESLNKVMLNLAKRVVGDGEGATKVIKLNIRNAKTKTLAQKISRKISNSLLVKTAMYGEDPNWGRIIASLGSISESTINVTKVKLFINKILCFDNGLPTDQGSKRLASSMKKNNIEITLDLNSGKAMQTIYFSDLSHEYVHINSAYTT